MTQNERDREILAICEAYLVAKEDPDFMGAPGQVAKVMYDLGVRIPNLGDRETVHQKLDVIVKARKASLSGNTKPR